MSRACMTCGVLIVVAVLGTGGCSAEGGAPGDCSDDLDNDGNGLIDCNDPGCADYEDCIEPDWDAIDLVGYATFLRLDRAYPEMYDPPLESVVWAQAKFFEPQAGDAFKDIIHDGFIPPMGECTVVDQDEIEEAHPPDAGLDAGMEVTLDGPSQVTIPRSPDSTGGYYYHHDSNQLESYQPGTYTVRIPGGPGFESLEITDALATPNWFNTEPDLTGGQFDSALYDTGFTFELSRSCDSVVLIVQFYTSNGTYDASGVCRFDSTETLHVPASISAPFGEGCSGVSTCPVRAIIECFDQRWYLLDSGHKFETLGYAVLDGLMFSA